MGARSGFISAQVTLALIAHWTSSVSVSLPFKFDLSEVTCADCCWCLLLSLQQAEG